MESKIFAKSRVGTREDHLCLGSETSVLVAEMACLSEKDKSSQVYLS